METVLCVSGPGQVRGVYQQPAGMEADPPPLLLGADVDPLLPAGVAAGVSLRRPAVQGEPLVQGTTCTQRITFVRKKRAIA